MDQRVIRVPARIRARVALLVEDLSREGRELDSRTSHHCDFSLLAAVNALSPVPIDEVDVELVSCVDVVATGVVAELEGLLLLRYGDDGGGLRTAREVAEIEGVEVADVLRADALFIQKMRLRSSHTSDVPGTSSALKPLPRSRP